MKAKILKNLTAKVVFDNDASVQGRFIPLLGTFQFPGSELSLGHDIAKVLRVVNIGDSDLIVLSYIFDGDYEPRRFFFPLGESYTITDHMTVFRPALGEGIHRVRIVLESEAEEVDVDENALTLLVHESADGMEYINGEKDRAIPLKEGTRFEAELLKKRSEKVLIKRIDGLKVTLEIDGKERLIDPRILYYEYESGGFNTAYDYQTWSRTFTIRLNIPEAIMVADRT